MVFGQKWRKQTPPKMANFGGVYFLHFFPKTTLNASKLQFLFKKSILRGSTFFTFSQKPLLVPQNCNFTSKTQNYKIRSNFGVPVRTQISIFFHFFNRYQEIIPKTFIWSLPQHSSIILKSIFVNFSEFGDILPSNFKRPVRTQIWPKFNSDKSFVGFIPISFI